MSESKSPYAAAEEQNEEVIQKGAEARPEQEVIGAEVIGPSGRTTRNRYKREKSRTKIDLGQKQLKKIWYN